MKPSYRHGHIDYVGIVSSYIWLAMIDIWFLLRREIDFHKTEVTFYN